MKAAMKAAMLHGMGTRGLELETTMVVREVENGYLIDVDLEGEMRDDQPTYLPRFAKIVARTGAELLSQVSSVLDKFNDRVPHFSQRIMGNLQMHEVGKRVMTVTRLLGGYVITTAEPVKVSIDPEEIKAAMPPGATMPELPEGAMPPSYEFTNVEMVERVVFSTDDVTRVVGLFFGLKGE